VKKKTVKVDVSSLGYADLYFHERTKLTYLESSALMTDPEFIDGIENLGIEWTWKVQDRDFIMGLFDKPEMKKVNNFLDRFAGEYKKREPEILKRLKSFGIR